MNKGAKRRGYSLLEAMISVILLAVGIVSVVSAYTSLARGQRAAIETEEMQRFAIDKYDELVATGALQTQTLNGDFSDRGDTKYVWDATVEPTGTQDLNALTVTVQPHDNSTQSMVSGVVYEPPQTTPGGTP